MIIDCGAIKVGFTGSIMEENEVLNLRNAGEPGRELGGMFVESAFRNGNEQLADVIDFVRNALKRSLGFGHERVFQGNSAVQKESRRTEIVRFNYFLRTAGVPELELRGVSEGRVSVDGGVKFFVAMDSFHLSSAQVIRLLALEPTGYLVFSSEEVIEMNSILSSGWSHFDVFDSTFLGCSMRYDVVCLRMFRSYTGSNNGVALIAKRSLLSACWQEIISNCTKLD